MSIKTLCKVLRRPGYVTATNDTYPGDKVNARAESNLMFVVYFIKHRYRVSIDVTFRNMTLSGVRKLSRQREMEDDAMAGSVTTPRVHTSDWLKTL